MRISKRKKETTADSGKKNGYSTSQLFNFSRDSYLERTSRPVSALFFLLPFIVFYEVGTFLINTDVLNRSQIRVVAFVWLQSLLESLGFSGKFAWVAPPLAVIVILIALQITSRRQWRFFLRDILPMGVECILLAVPLIVLTLFLNSAGSHNEAAWMDNTLKTPSGSILGFISLTGRSVQSLAGQDGGLFGHSLLTNIVTGIGAGIYEELVFRLILICLLMLFFQDVLGLSHQNSIVLSVLISAALFSAHHHIDFFSGRQNAIDPFDFVRFTFRTIAGIYFAALFAIRGFGITAGTHAFYNIIAVTITAQFFHH